MAKVERFEDLHCWQGARILNKRVFEICEQGRIVKDFDSKSQIKRASVSIMNNIAEGFARYHRKDFRRFLDIAQSSASEVKSMLYVMEDMNYATQEELLELHTLTDKTRSQILALIKYLNISLQD